MRKFAVYCQDPQWITNRWNKEKIFVSCGRCSACLSLRHMRYVHLMEEEGKCFRYSFFCTLTYSDRFVPKLYFNEDKSRLQNSYDKIYIDVTPAIVNNIDLHWFGKKKYFEYCRYKDFQLFIKRLRQNYLRNVPLEELEVSDWKYVSDPSSPDGVREVPIYQTPRYYCSDELGPTTIRPHFHCIIYFNSKWFAEHFEQMFYKSWSRFNRHSRRRYCIGVRSTCRPCVTDANRYTAAYCDAVVGLPALHRCKEIRPRHSYSRLPVLGNLSWDWKALSQKLHSGALRCFNGVSEKGVPVVVQVPQSIENKLFPRAPQFNNLSRSSRIVAYRALPIVKEMIGYEPDYYQFAGYLHRHRDWFIRLIPEMRQHILDQCFYQPAIKRPFYQLYYASKRFNFNCKLHGLDPYTYTRMIEEYWSLKDYYRLSDWYEILEHLSRTEDVRPYYSQTYDGVGELFRSRYKLSDSINYRAMVALTNKLHMDRVKTKKERDYQLRGNAVVYDPNNSYKW